MSDPTPAAAGSEQTVQTTVQEYYEYGDNAEAYNYGEEYAQGQEEYPQEQYPQDQYGQQEYQDQDQYTQQEYPQEYAQEYAEAAQDPAAAYGEQQGQDGQWYPDQQADTQYYADPVEYAEEAVAESGDQSVEVDGAVAVDVAPATDKPFEAGANDEPGEAEPKAKSKAKPKTDRKCDSKLTTIVHYTLAAAVTVFNVLAACMTAAVLDDVFEGKQRTDTATNSVSTTLAIWTMLVCSLAVPLAVWSVFKPQALQQSATHLVALIVFGQSFILMSLAAKHANAPDSTSGEVGSITNTMVSFAMLSGLINMTSSGIAVVLHSGLGLSAV